MEKREGGLEKDGGWMERGFGCYYEKEKRRREGGQGREKYEQGAERGQNGRRSRRQEAGRQGGSGGRAGGREEPAKKSRKKKVKRRVCI